MQTSRIAWIGRGARFFAKRIKLVSLPGCQCHADAFAGEEPRQRCAQALASSDDQCCLIFHGLHEFFSTNVNLVPRMGLNPMTMSQSSAPSRRRLWPWLRLR